MGTAPVTTTEERFREFLTRLAEKQQCDLPTAAHQLIEHEWGEVNERFGFYPAMRKALTAQPLEIVAVRECVNILGKMIRGGHASFRGRVKDFLASDVAVESLKGLIGDSNTPPPVERIDTFIESLFDKGFRNRRGNQSGGDAAYFTSVILTSVFPDNFVECRINRWHWMAEQFDLPMATEQDSYGTRLATAAAAAKQLSETPTFQEFFSSEHPLWTAGGIAFLLHRNPDLRSLVNGDVIPPLSVDQPLVDAFARFKSDPSAKFVVQMRRLRAQQIRVILAEPDAIDLEVFNREVWVYSSTATCQGEDVKAALAATAKISPDQLELLNAGLGSGKLDLHGNFMWGTATRIFGPMVPGNDADRLGYIRQAVEILNDDNLDPLDKAKAILEIPGFGDNSATGLVMVFHPRDFAIKNGASTSAVRKLGFQAGELAEFQLIVTRLRDALHAEDFLELDYFLFLLDQGLTGLSVQKDAWWVCQGTMFEAERKGSYVFAPLATSDGKGVQNHANLALMSPGQTVLHYAKGALRAIGEVIELPIETTRPDDMRGENAGERGNLVRVRYTDIRPPIDLDEIPEDWRTGGEAPFTKKGKVKQGYAFSVSPSFLSRLKATFADRFEPRSSDETVHPKPPRVVKIAPGEGACFWNDCLENGYICVGWGQIGDLRKFADKDAFRAAFSDEFGEGYNNHQPTISRKANELWTLQELRPGDIVVANQGISRVLGVGEVLDPPYDFQQNSAPDEYSHLVLVKWDTSVAKDIPKQGFWAMTTVADVPSDLYEFIVGKDKLPTEKLPPLKEYVEPSFDKIREYVAAARLRIPERTLRRYHLSLKTRGFVVLCGLSGSGKTWLAELYAKAVGAERELVPVAPNWTTNEDLIGYFNPMDGHYHHTAFSRFLSRAAEHFEESQAAGVTARPFHLILDEMNLARVEYYFAKFLSAMEQRSRATAARIDLGGNEYVNLPPNLYFIGTVNVDETTHGFADKVFDRAQLLEMGVDRETLAEHLGQVAYAAAILGVWDVIKDITPFAFRVIDEVKSYVAEAEKIGVTWQDALDEQLLQKVLTKVKGAEQRVEKVLEQFLSISEGFPLSHAKALRMLEILRHHGITSYF